MKRDRNAGPRRLTTTLTNVESLEPRAMLAGAGPETWGSAGLVTAPQVPGDLSSSGILLTCSSPTLGSLGTASPPATAAGSGDSPSGGGLWLPITAGSGAVYGSTGTGATGGGVTNGPALSSQLPAGSGTPSTGTTTGATPSSNALWLASTSGSGTSSSGSTGGVNNNGPALSSQTTGSTVNSGHGGSLVTGGSAASGGDLSLTYSAGSGTGSSTSASTGGVSKNGPALSSEYTEGSGTDAQGIDTTSSGTLSGSDLWFSYGAGSGAGSSSARASGGSFSNLLALLSQYNDGASAGGRGNCTGGTRSNAELWIFYGAGAGAGPTSGSTNGSLANDPALAAQYSGGSVTGRITPLVYQFGSDDGPGFVSGVWTSDDGGLQFVPVADTGTGQTDEGTSAGTQTWDGPVAPLGDRTYLVWDDSFGWQIVTDPPPKASPKNGDTTEGEQRDLSAGSIGTVTGGLIEEKLPIARAETEKFLTDTARDLAIALAFAGIGRIATARASQYVPTSVDPNKFKYIFGEVTSNPHNQARSLQNAAQMNRIGIQNTAEGWKYLTQHLQQIAQDSANVVRTIQKTLPDGSTVTLEIRESLLSGPGGFLKLESTWEILADGTRRLSTVMLFGG